jgi:hypothetical protein
MIRYYPLKDTQTALYTRGSADIVYYVQVVAKMIKDDRQLERTGLIRMWLLRLTRPTSAKLEANRHKVQRVARGCVGKLLTQ